MTFTVMITTRNRCADLEKTLTKVATLMPSADEVLICADGCADGTEAMIRHRFPTFTLIQNATSRGSVFSRDRMLRTARSEIVLSIDDDSYPVCEDFLAKLTALFLKHPDAAVISFPEIRDESCWNETGENVPSSQCVSAYANCAAAMRRDIYLVAPGFPVFFEHMYEEPDYALQCYALGYEVRLERSLSVRHHVSSVQRDPIRRHHLNARNELWSVWMRCPFPQLFPVSLFRVWRQFRYACRVGIAWAIREPAWWWSALKGIGACLRRREQIPWPVYYRWMKLARSNAAAPIRREGLASPEP